MNSIGRSAPLEFDNGSDRAVQKSAMWLAEVLADVLEDLSPPGRTAFSVAVAQGCAPEAETCEGAKRSTFYGGAWVRQETAEQARLRYAVIAQAIPKAASNVLCLTEHDVAIEGCKPYDTGFKKQNWGVMYLSLAAMGAATYESGYREDVQVGRGHARKISDDGGMGRGPGSEGCLMQVHPQSAWAYAPDVDPELYKRASKGDRAAREAIVLTLVGLDEESVVRCFETGMRMLVKSRAYCAWASPKTDPRWAMYAQYGTGNSCTSSNDGKTVLRQRLYESLIHKVRTRSDLRSIRSPR